MVGSDRFFRRVAWSLAGMLLVCGVIFGTKIIVYLKMGEGIVHAVEFTPIEYGIGLAHPGGMDSLGPMLSGWARARRLGEAPPAGSPYQVSLERDRCKFQYPPASWLLLELLPEPPGLPLPCALHAGVKAEPGAAPLPTLGTVPWAPRGWYAVASAVGCLALIALSVALLWQRLLRAPSRQAAWYGATAAAAVLGLSFYPLVKPHLLGNLQVFINLCIAGALLLLPSRPATSGALLGLCGIFKPQYIPLVLWGLLRRQRRFAAGFVAVMGVGHGIAFARYGFEIHVQYLEWLRYLSQVGEVFWANQSINGIMNRLLGTGDPVVFQPDAFAAYHPVVRWTTLVTSGLLLAAALWAPARAASSPPSPERLQLDLATMLCALTLASPIAWEHHYGGFLPVFALLLAVLASQDAWPRRSAWLLGAAFLLMALSLLPPHRMFTSPALGLLTAHLWVGAMLLFGLLLYWRRATVPGGTRPA